MKKLAAILCLSALTTGAFAQGLVQFANGVGSLISSTQNGTSATLAAAPVGSYYFGLLTSTTAAGPFTFANVYATNTAAGSKLGPPTYQPSVAGWTAGTTMFFEVAGWSASEGAIFNNSWLVNNAPNNSFNWASGFFGLSGIGSGVATASPAPAFPLFGGTALPGFSLGVVPVPEPTSMALAGLGAAALLIFRRRK